MFRQLLFLAIATPLCASAMAALACTKQDASFSLFLKRFKHDQEFREARLVLPLQTSQIDPDGKKEEKLTLVQIRKTKWEIIRGDAYALEMKGTEGELCESKVVIKNNRASFGQYSCGRDVYSDTYYFVKKNGCWMLARVEGSAS